MNFISRLYLCGVLLLFVAACAAPTAVFRDRSLKTSERIRGSDIETLFPSEVKDFHSTVDQGNAEHAKGEIATADAYYGLALGKADILKKLYREELEKRKEAARLEAERKRQAEAELELQKQLEREKAEAAAREAAARAHKLEAERAEARKRAEKSRQEKEPQPVSRHSVKRGETLPQIAALPEVYADSSLWPLIYKANRDQISNPAVDRKSVV